ncbi:Conserved_hypothetical protein [Hexamita inflata]|uniref:Uncharacterized protein n=1 Tax=Hexamita inflata TaxID=28002 RepID=A0AA86Q7E8_9EUKA|nr:Conserved hypothetical protein [Hexamita inflata]
MFKTQLYNITALINEIPQDNKNDEQNSNEQFNENFYVNECQLMNLVKLFLQREVYLAVEDNSIIIFNKNFKIIKNIPVKYDIYPGFLDFEANRFNANFGLQTNATICNGEIFVRRFEEVYKLFKGNLILVSNIPEIQFDQVQDYYSSGLFSYQNELYAFNNSGNVFKLVNEQFIHIRKDSKYYYQYCDQIVSYDYKTLKFETIDKKLLFRDNLSENVRLVVNHGGVVVLQKGDTLFVVNMVEYSIEKYQIDISTDEFLSNFINLGYSGLYSKPEALNYDQHFQEQANAIFSSYMKKLELNQNWIREISNIFDFTTIFDYQQYDFAENMDNIQQRFQLIENVAKTQINRILYQTINLKSTIELISNKLLDCLDIM